MPLLYRNILLVSLTLLTVACTSPQPTVSTEELKARADDAMRLQVLCAARNISEIDDGISDAQSVALALSLRCHREYQQAIEAFGSANLDNDDQRRMFREKSNQPQKRIEAFLPRVMHYRASLRKEKL